MEEKRVFYSQGQKLVANLTYPFEGAPCIVMSHGFDSSKDGTKWSYMSPRFSTQGFAVFRFTYRGCGQGEDKSEGEFEDTTLTSRVQDFTAALEYLETAPMDLSRWGAIGSSFGGSVVVAARDPRVKAVVLLATPSHFPPPTPQEQRELDESGLVSSYYGRRIKRAYFENVQKYDLRRDMREIGVPILIIHGSLDSDVPPGNAYELYQYAGEPKGLEIIEGGAHDLNQREHLERVFQFSVEWFKRYL